MRSQSVPPLLSQVKRALLFPFTFALCWSRKEGRSIESTIWALCGALHDLSSDWSDTQYIQAWNSAHIYVGFTLRECVSAYKWRHVWICRLRLSRRCPGKLAFNEVESSWLDRGLWGKCLFKRTACSLRVQRSHILLLFSFLKMQPWAQLILSYAYIAYNTHQASGWFCSDSLYLSAFASAFLCWWISMPLCWVSPHTLKLSKLSSPCWSWRKVQQLLLLK